MDYITSTRFMEANDKAQYLKIVDYASTCTIGTLKMALSNIDRSIKERKEEDRFLWWQIVTKNKIHAELIRRKEQRLLDVV